VGAIHESFDRHPLSSFAQQHPQPGPRCRDLSVYRHRIERKRCRQRRLAGLPEYEWSGIEADAMAWAEARAAELRGARS